MFKGEVLDRVSEGAAGVYISASPGRRLHLRILQRLRPRFPQLKIVVAVWHAEGDLEKGRSRLLAAGASDVVITLKDAIEKLPPAALVTAMQSPEVQADVAAAANRTSSAPSTT